MYRYVFNPTTNNYDVYTLDPHKKIGVISADSFTGKILEQLRPEFVRLIEVEDDTIHVVTVSVAKGQVDLNIEGYKIDKLEYLGGIFDIVWKKEKESKPQPVKQSEDQQKETKEEPKETKSQSVKESQDQQQKEAKEEKPKRRRGRPPKKKS